MELSGAMDSCSFIRHRKLIASSRRFRFFDAEIAGIHQRFRTSTLEH